MERTTIVAVAALISAMFAASGDAIAVDTGKTLTWPGGGRGEVRFEGKEHAKKGHACKDCHSGLFSMKFGTAAMTMAALDSGQYCGACHNGTVTFSTKDPKKCHECHRGGSKFGKHEGQKDKEHKKDD